MNLPKPFHHKQVRFQLTPYLVWILLIFILLVSIFILLTQYQLSSNSSPDSSFNFSTSTPMPLPTQPVVTISLPSPTTPTPPPIKTIIIDAPFASQAPFAQWSDARFQDACEETSSLIAYSWVHDLPLTPQIANDTIIKLAQYQSDNFGSFVDTSVEDTVIRILRGYFQLKNIKIIIPDSSDDLVRILQSNKLIIAPMDGQMLNNPNFTAPGPERHMLVISGYDISTKQFITQDPGTRNGRNFRYTSSNLWQSIRDYPTGDHIDIPSFTPKRIIVISKN